MGQFGFGQSVKRKEDPRLLTGRGQFIDDISMRHQAHAYILRSPHSHAEMKITDITAAQSAPGVIAVLTGAELAEDAITGVPSLYSPPVPPGVNPADWDIVKPPFPALAQGRVRLVGNAVALVVAESREQARDAAEMIEVDYQPLPSVTSTSAAAAPGAPIIWPQAAGNVCFQWQDGDREAVERVFDHAAHVVGLDVINNRVVLAAIETRGVVADFNPDDGRFTLYATTQNPHGLKKQLAPILGVAEHRMHVKVGDVGGGFGGKNGLIPEQILLLWAARRIGRPVKWVADRSEAFLTDYAGRDNVTRGELALDAHGKFLAMRVSLVANMGAYLANKSALSPTMFASAHSGIYATPHIHVAVTGVFANVTATDPYRGAGRPEATYILERIIDQAASEIGIDRIELRRRNLIPISAMPFDTPLGLRYDSGDFAKNLDDALHLSDWAGFEQRRRFAAGAGKLRGIGLANYIERTAGNWSEIAGLRLDADGSATALVGSVSNGQGTETAFSQLVADRLGLHFDDINVIEGDTDLIVDGKGTGGSASIAVAGAALMMATDDAIDKARLVAAHLLEATATDLEFSADHGFSIVGTDRCVTLAEVARAAHNAEALPDSILPGLLGNGYSKRPNSTYPNGCHVCEIEIDRDTGALKIITYVMIHDVGKVLNPLLVAGQMQGGVVQGLGQAAFENCVYDDANGQMLSASFMDYCIPRADDLPDFVLQLNETPSPTNALGVKGCGESGSTGAPPALVNAVADALSALGPCRVDMPITAEGLWRTINNAAADH
ncbi:MAG: carbon-monoxide dehydrogenase large subunit [Gammaproteobacteria bacterium]|jgi:carbon-monoxide dehydrogenase large subunit